MENKNHDRELRVSKTINAPIALVWKAWSQSQHIAEWWGPAGFTNTINEMDFTAGGKWRLTMHGPDGKHYANSSQFVKIIPLQKIVFQHFNPNYLATIIFEPQGDDATLLHWSMLFETAEMLETVIKVFKADDGLQQNLVKLENYLEQLKNHP